MTAGKTPVTGGPALSNTLTFSKKLTYTLGSGALAFQNAYCALVSLAGAANTTLDLSGSLVDFVNSASMALTGVKALVVALLGAADTAPDGITLGTTCTSVTIGNASAPCLFGFDAGTDTWTIFNGDFFAATKSTAAGWAVANGSTDGLKILNNDATNTAKVLVIIDGI